MELNRLLIAVNSSAFSLRAAKIGFDISVKMDAEVALLFVIDRAKESLSAEYGPTREQSQMILLKEAGETLDQMARMYPGKRQLYKFIPEGFPQEEINNFAKEWKADLIVIGMHKRTGISQFFGSGHATDIIRHACVPVLVIPPNMSA